jgi:predicted HTH domain antitoxin
MRSVEVITKSVRLEPVENDSLRRASQDTGLSEAALMKRYILEGLARHRLEEALRAYSNGEIDLSAAANYAGVSVYQMMAECERRDVTPAPAREKFIDGLQTLTDTFGGSDALRIALQELKGA